VISSDKDSCSDDALPARLAGVLLARSHRMCWLSLDASERVVRGNAALARLVGKEQDALGRLTAADLLLAEDLGALRALYRRPSGHVASATLRFVEHTGNPRHLDCLLGRVGSGLMVVGEPIAPSERLESEMFALNSDLVVLARERARRVRALLRSKAAAETDLQDLRDSYWHLPRAQAVLPICVSCGKVRATSGEWQTLVDYLRDNTEFLSHGYCPECTCARQSPAAPPRNEP
jgi:hypothetical protein